jgi:hypothetical protein
MLQWDGLASQMESNLLSPLLLRVQARWCVQRRLDLVSENPNRAANP